MDGGEGINSPSGTNGLAERINELDVLRGFALLGVFVVHFTLTTFSNLPLDPQIAGGWREIRLHDWTLIATDLFFYDKANTLFATLFGMGFWVMMERLKARQANFNTIYLRRLFVLLAIGWINMIAIFPGDVLHTYAFLGFILFALRGLPPSVMLVLGLGLAIGGHDLGDRLVWFLIGDSAAYGEAQAAAFAKGGYLDWISLTAPAYLADEFLQGGSVGWWLYLLGRFLIGAWIVRVGLLGRIGASLPALRWICLPVLAAGLALEGLSSLLHHEVVTGPFWLDAILHALAVPVLATGYALCLIVACHARLGPAITALFAPIGRMALTAYVLHGGLLTFIFFPFGLGLLGQIAPAYALVLVVAIFVAMALACRAWLSIARYGPLEYLWRWATHGQRPVLFHPAAGPAPSSPAP